MEPRFRHPVGPGGRKFRSGNPQRHGSYGIDVHWQTGRADSVSAVVPIHVDQKDILADLFDTRAAEQDPTILGSGQNPVQVLGFCTGLLPASAIIAARDTSELFTLAREIISITFRMAYEIRRRMLLIEDDPSSWAMTYVGLTAEKMEKILDEFHKSQVSEISCPFLRVLGKEKTISSMY